MKLPKTFLAVNLSDAFTFQEKPQGGDEAIEADPEPEATPETEPAKEGQPEAAVKPGDTEAAAVDNADAATVETDKQSDVLEIKIPKDYHVHVVEADDDAGNAESVAVTESADASGGASPLPEMEAQPPLSAVTSPADSKEPEDKA